MRRFGLIGRPLGHSASAAYFAAKFEREGIADCTYTLYELPEIGALERLLAETPDLCGFNVTIPYKREVMALLDDLSHDARLVGAVNCVRRTADSRLVGHNTDVIGLRAAFDCLLGGEQPSHALVLGTGGASQAVQYVLAERGIPFDLVSGIQPAPDPVPRPGAPARGAHTQRRGDVPPAGRGFVADMERINLKTKGI